MSEEQLPIIQVVSPTGTPLIPPKLVPILVPLPALLVGIGAALPAHTWAAKMLPALGALLAGLLGILSPGLRKAP